MIGVRKKPAQALTKPGKAAKNSKRRGAASKAAATGVSARPRGANLQTAPIAVQRKATPQKIRPATSSQQARARAKARKAKAPRVIRTPLRERIVSRLADIDLRPHVWVSKVPFVVLVIGALGLGLGITLWLSTDAAERSYQLGSQRRTNESLTQRKEALERDVLRAESAPALADSARDLGMIPSHDIAHLVQDPQGNWFLVGAAKPAEGVAPPPFNTPIPDDPDTVPKAGNSVEVPIQLPPPPAPAPPAVAAMPDANAPAGVAPAAPGPAQDPLMLAPGAPIGPAPGPVPVAAAAAGDAPQALNSTNQPPASEQFNPVATTSPNPSA